MSAYKDPSFQERTALARQARQKALDQLKAKPPADEAVLAERNAARIAREQAKADERAATRAARDLAKAEEKARAIEAAKASVPPPGPSKAEQRTARDARYAPPKQRNNVLPPSTTYAASCHPGPHTT